MIASRFNLWLRPLSHNQTWVRAFRVVIVGRPNVGKSSLFNRLVGRKQSIVYDKPGVTRDRIEGFASIGGLKFDLTDTAGLDDGFDLQGMDGESAKKGPHIAASGIG
jgi:small GTP-binding protein